jgi:dephospho-CoA kinase
VERLIASRGLTLAEAATRVDSQPPEADKVARADVVIQNDSELAAMDQQVAAAWRAVEAGTAPRRRGDPR